MRAIRTSRSIARRSTWTSLRTIIQTRLGPGDVDVLDYDTGPGFGGVLAKAGLVADMKPYYEKYGWTFFDWAKSRCTYAGTLTCVPHQVEELGIFYNTKMFADNGLSVPTTLDEFESTMDTLKAKGIVPLAFGDQPQWPAFHQFSMVLSNILGHAGMESKLYGDKPWNDPDTVKAIDLFFRQFLTRGYFPKDPNAITYEDANALFYAGKAAMIPTGTWLVSEISDKTKGKFDVGFFPFPSIDGSSVSPPSGLGSGGFLARNSKHPDQAAVFLDWLQQPEQIRTWDLQTYNTIPAQPVDVSGVDVSALFATVLADLATTSGTTPDFGYSIDVLTPANFNDAMSSGFQQVLSGKLTPQQMADKLEAAYKVAIGKGDTIQRP